MSFPYPLTSLFPQETSFVILILFLLPLFLSLTHALSTFCYSNQEVYECSNIHTAHRVAKEWRLAVR